MFIDRKHVVMVGYGTTMVIRAINPIKRKWLNSRLANEQLRGLEMPHALTVESVHLNAQSTATVGRYPPGNICTPSNTRREAMSLGRAKYGQV